MAIRVTPTGEIITRGGLPSCTCCTPCPACYVICVLINSEYVTLYGNVTDGYDGVTIGGDSVSVEWYPGDIDTPAGWWWVIVTLLGPVLEAALLPATTIDCTPLNTTGTDETYEVTLTVMPTCGSCDCECSPDQTELCVRVEWSTDGVNYTVYNTTLYGGMCAGSFASLDGAIVLFWNGTYWDAACTEGLAGANFITSNTNHCELVSPSPAEFRDDMGMAPSSWMVNVIGYGPGCCDCDPNVQSFDVVITNIDDTIMDTLTLTGDTCDGAFTGSSLWAGAVDLIWFAGEWTLSSTDSGGGGAVNALGVITEDVLCSPEGAYTGDGYTFTLTPA